MTDDREVAAVAARMYAADDTANARRAFRDGVAWGRAHPVAAPPAPTPPAQAGLEL